MSTEVSIRNAVTLPSETEFQMFQVVAKNAAASGLYAGVGSEQKIFMILLAARELGIGPMSALNGGLWNIKGRIEISARLMTGMIRRAGHSIIQLHSDDEKCVLQGVRKDNGDTITESFTLQDATKAGLMRSDAWKNYTKDMLYNRAMSRLARRLFPDVIGTAYVEGEISDADPKKDKNTIEAEIVNVDEKMPNEIIQDLSEEEIENYLQHWIPTQAEFKTWMIEISTRQKWNIRKTIEQFEKNRDYTEKTFKEWLEKQKT